MPEISIPVKGESRTAVQSVAAVSDMRMDRRDEAVLSKSLPATYRTYRKIRKHPTVALARAWAVAIVASGDWGVEVDDDVPDDLTAFVKSQLLRQREMIVGSAMECGIDYGWCPYEVVWGTKDIDGRKRIVIDKVKPLLVDLTDIVVKVPDGTFAGLRQMPIQGFTDEVWLERDESMLVSFRVEGQQYYGEGLLEAARLTYLNWGDANAAADRYDQKIAGAHWVIQYPVGKTPVGGVEVDNFELATGFAQNLQSSGAIVVPLMLTRAISNLNESVMGEAWKIELRDHAAQQTAFGARLDYLDKLLVRSMLSAERSVLEGTHGTLAEAEAHSDVPILIRDREHRHITSIANEYLVKPLVRMNEGEEWEEKVRLVASPLADAKIGFFREMFKLMVNNPSLTLDIMNQTDLDALFDALDWPKGMEVANMPVAGGAPGNAPVPAMAVPREMAARLASLYRASMADDYDIGDNGHANRG